LKDIENQILKKQRLHRKTLLRHSLFPGASKTLMLISEFLSFDRADIERG
jgi:hypothetical protein